MTTPNTDEFKAKIDAFVNASADRMCYLYDRWQDEYQYEDFNDYIDAMRKMLPDDFKFEGATRRPFGVRFSIKGAGMYFFGVNSTKLYWKRVG